MCSCLTSKKTLSERVNSLLSIEDVDDTVTIMPNIETASNFLDTLNQAHFSVKFTMETECNGMLPFLGIQLLNRSPQIETKVYVKPTNSGLLLHYQSHVDNRYKKGLLRTMLDRTHRLSSSWTHFSDECVRLKTVFSRLKYPKHLVNSTIKSFVDSKVCDQQQPLSPSQEKDDTIRVVLPFKDQISADIVKKQLKDLSLKVHTTIQPVFEPKNRTRTKCEGNKATNCKSAVCCLRFSTVSCGLCRLHTRTFT